MLLTLESQDSYYCDPDILGSSACSGWKEVDLDDKVVPLQYMYVKVGLEYGTTDANGNFSLTFERGGSQCAGQTVDLTAFFARVHEADAGPHAPAPRFRFWITDIVDGAPGNYTWSKNWYGIPLTGPTTAWSGFTWSRGSTAHTTRMANIYYTANSMLKEVTTWSSNLDSRFTGACCLPQNGFRIGVQQGFDDGGLMTLDINTVPSVTKGILIGYNAYGYGGIIRDEIGHATHFNTHKGQRDWRCFFDHQTCPSRCGPGLLTCEYGSTATMEGLSIFFATRSIATSNTNTKVWGCTCWDGALLGGNGDICSEHAAIAHFLPPFNDPDGQNDSMFKCQTGDPNPDFFYVGDHRVNDTGDCAKLSYDGGCNCGQSGSPPYWCSESFNLANGWRNDRQIVRFLWDFIDGTNDDFQDNNDYGVSDVVAALEGMACSGDLGGQDGTCEEQAPPLLSAGPPKVYGDCSPTNANNGDTSPSGTGTRDSFNAYDLASALPGDQSSLRILNCVQGAPD